MLGQDTRLIEALARLHGVDAFGQVVQGLKKEVEHLAKEAHDERQDVNFRWNQGRQQALREFLDLCEKAPALVRGNGA